MMKCVIIDDEPLALNVIEEYVHKISFLELLATFTCAEQALEFLKDNVIDLIFVDIQMPDMTGLELVEQLEYKPMVVFTTAYGEYALDGFKADAIDYLLKPIDFPEFMRAVEKAREWHNGRTSLQVNKDFLFIKSEYKIVRINFDDIRYIQGMSEYVKIFVRSAKPIMSLISLKSIEQKLPPQKFMRVHKSFIVNLNQINVIERGEIVYDDGVIIPISAQYKEKFQRFIDENFIL